MKALILVVLGLSANAYAWGTKMSCENESVRFESVKIAPYQEAFQLVIANSEVIEALKNSGGVNAESLNQKGELVLSNIKSEYAHWAYMTFLSRDAGQLKYSIQLSYENHKMTLSVGYFEGAMPSYVRPFTGVTFYNCSYF